MKKLTAEKCREQFEAHIRNLDGDYNLIRVGEVYIDVETQIEWRTWQAAWNKALEIALPILEQQERDEGEPVYQFIVNNPEHDGYIQWADCNPDFYSKEPSDRRRILYTAPPLQQERGEGEWIEEGGQKC